MPWGPEDAHDKTHKANSATSKRQWAHVANSAMAHGASEGSAIRQANAVVARRGHHHHRKRGRLHDMR